MFRYKTYKFRIYPDELQRVLIEKTLRKKVIEVEKCFASS